jgi:hypothetical protein
MTDLILFCFLGILSTTIVILGGDLSSGNPTYGFPFYVLGGDSCSLSYLRAMLTQGRSFVGSAGIILILIRGGRR